MSRHSQSPIFGQDPAPELIHTLNDLIITGKHQELVECLLQWHAASHQDSETNSQEGGSESDPKLDHTRTVPKSQDNSRSSDRGNDNGQVDSLSKEASSPSKDGCYTCGQHPNPQRRHHSHHQHDGRHTSRHQQHRSYHQHEWAHTSSHRSHYQHDRGPTQRLKHSPTPLAFQVSQQVDPEALPLSTEPSLKISTLTTAHQTNLPCTTQPVIIRQLTGQLIQHLAVGQL